MSAPPDIAALLAPYRGRGREALLPILWEVQTAHGHISAAAVQQISHCIRIPEADIYGVISFYSLFYERPSGETILRVCGDPSCALEKSDEIEAALRARLGLNGAGMSADGRYGVERAPCLGLCEHAPAAPHHPPRRRRTGRGAHPLLRRIAAGGRG